MNEYSKTEITDRWILSRRGPKNEVDPYKPYGWLVEKERSITGAIEDVATIFLTNRECPYHCLMCDLWKNTTDKTLPVGAIPRQIEWALNRLPEVKHLKLYNSGSFFDQNAIPEKDYINIASLVRHFETVIVESHPRFINTDSLIFRDMIKTNLHIALGLETVNRVILEKLNKRMTLNDFNDSIKFLSGHGVPVRAFILLKPPFLSESEGIFWAERSVDFAFRSGVECCVIIPVREGNGAMEQLRKEGLFIPPIINSLEKVLEYGIGFNSGRVFADTWDLDKFSKCDVCFNTRVERMIKMNLDQIIPERIQCLCDK